MTEMTLQLKTTLHQLYGDDVIYASRPSFEYNPWLTAEQHQSHLLTARELLIADLPVIVHRATVTDKTKQLFEAANIEMPDNYIVYETREEYEQILKDAVKDGKKLYLQYPHELELVPAESYVVHRQTFLDLNNKARLDEWTKGKYLPKRKVVMVDELTEELKRWELPYVLKPGDELPTAGGYGVMICFTEEDVEKALKRINDSHMTDQYIIEQYIDSKKNYCVQYSASGEDIQYIGASIQIVEKYGKYRGNVSETHVPEKIIEAGYDIMKNGVEQGYKGIAGFDLLLDEAGEVYAIDLNFRQNGSTAMLILEDSLEGEYKKFMAYYSDGDNDTFFKKIKQYVEGGHLFPLAYLDGDYFNDNESISRFVCIWHGTEEEVTRLDKEFSALRQVNGGEADEEG